MLIVIPCCLAYLAISKKSLRNNGSPPVNVILGSASKSPAQIIRSSITFLHSLKESGFSISQAAREERVKMEGT